MASSWYNNGLEQVMKGQINLSSDDIRVLLVTSSYTYDETHDFVDDITNELSGGSYVRKALTGETVTQEDASDRASFSADNVTWTALGAAAGTPAAAIVYKFVSTDANSILIARLELTSPPAPNGGDYTVKWNNGSSSGDILRATRA